MFRRFIITCAALSVLATGMAAQEKTVMVGGAPMYPSKDIIDNARRRGEGGRAREHAQGCRAVHRVRADECGV
jgi:hypothetical protein